MPTNLPKISSGDSAEPTRLFFDTYGIAPLEFNSIEVDAATAFFQLRGFEEDAALVTTSALLKQAKLDNMPVQKLLDTLTGFDDLQISALVGEILNNNRSPISTLGFKVNGSANNYITRNVAV